MIRLAFFIVLGSILSCIRPPDYSDVPVLEFRSVDKTVIKQGLFKDSFTVVLFFTDGDGDFGHETKSNEMNIFMKDNRTGNPFGDFKAPLVPTQGANNGISGTISVLLAGGTCCVFPQSSGIPPCSVDSSFPSNDLTLDIYIKDRAGNQSNTVTTSVIKLMCI